MDHGLLTRRYGPLVAAIAIQLLIIVIAPSVAPTANSGAAGGPGGPVPGGGVAAGPTAGTGSSGPGKAGSPTAGSGAGGSASQGASGAAGVGKDTSHCVQGREFSPAIDYFAPPCTPGKPGAPDPGNGGGTWQGVTGNKIEVVEYYPNYGAEVNTVLKAEGLYVTIDQVRAYVKAAQNFINSHYVLYGRQIHIDVYQGTCTSSPPDYPCLISEMDRIAQQYHPYAFTWINTVCSACYTEMSRNKVVNLGGSGFSDKFNASNAPYHWDAAESGTQEAQSFAGFWCHQMTSVGTSRKVAFAGTENPAQNFNGKPRVLGVLTPNDPENEYVVQHDLEPALQNCGDKVAHSYFYSQNANTAAQQEQAGTAALDTPSNPATSVLCMCDPVAPAFAYNGAANANYWPENLLASDQAQDLDTTGQSYEDNNGKSSLACPNPSQGCEFDNALGLSSVGNPVPQNGDPGTAVWHAGGGQGNTPFDSQTATVYWGYYNMLASLIEATGPDLTPVQMAQAAPSLGARGGGTTGHELRAFSPGEYTWVRDNRVVYWNKHRPSPYNGKPGTYIPIEGSRFTLGQFPMMNQPPAPPPAQRR